MNENTLFKSWVIGPGKDVEVNASGRFMYVEQCDGDASISLDDGSPFKIRSGFEFVNRDFSKFRLISNVGTGGADVTIRIYAGNIYVSNRNPVVYVRPVSRYNVASLQAIASGGTYTVPTTNLRTGQKTADSLIMVQFQNMTVGANLGIYDSTSNTQFGDLGAYGAANNLQIFETTTALKLVNATFGSVTVGVLAYYALPT